MRFVVFVVLLVAFGSLSLGTALTFCVASLPVFVGMDWARARRRKFERAAARHREGQP